MATNNPSYTSATDDDGSSWPPSEHRPRVDVVASHQMALYADDDVRSLPPPRRRSAPYRFGDDPVDDLSTMPSPTKRRSYIGHVALASVVVIINPPFGLVALWLAMTARTKSRSDIEQDRQSANKRATASLWTSATGVLVMAIIVIVAISVATSGSSSSSVYGDEATTEMTMTTPYVVVTKLTGSTTRPPATTCTGLSGYWYGGHCYAYRIAWNESDVLAFIARRQTDLGGYVLVNNATDNVTELTTMGWTNQTMTTTGVGNATNASITQLLQSTTMMSTMIVSTQPPPPSPLQACQFGVPDVADPWLCYYNDRRNASGSPSAPCHGGDWRPADDFCYRTVTFNGECTAARNYHNGHCYEYLLPVAKAGDCRHGYYKADLRTCYYDAGFPSIDPSCLGYKADRGNPMTVGDDGWCYYSSRGICLFAANYYGTTCYDYAVPNVKQIDCRHGYFARGNCYYRNAVPARTSCDASKADVFGFYCYSN